MLGETVLQIVIASHDNAAGEGQGVAAFPAVLLEPVIVAALAGFLIALTLMAAFQAIVHGQHDSADSINADIGKKHETEARAMERVMSAKGSGAWTMHRIAGKATALAHISSKVDEANTMYGEAQQLLLKIRALNVVSDFLWQVMAMAVMLTGVAIKLVMYSPGGTASPHALIATRLIIAAPIVTCFVVQLFHAVVLKARHHYSRDTLTRQPMHVLVLLSRVSLLALQIALVWIVPPDILGVEAATPYRFLGLQSILCLAQVVMLKVQEHKYPATSKRAHPLARVPLALHALRLRAAQARLADHAAKKREETGARTRAHP
jgi:hypothetical protein